MNINLKFIIGKYTYGIEEYDQGLKLDPKNPVFYLKKAKC